MRLARTGRKGLLVREIHPDVYMHGTSERPRGAFALKAFHGASG